MQAHFFPVSIAMKHPSLSKIEQNLKQSFALFVAIVIANYVGVIQSLVHGICEASAAQLALQQ